MAGRVTAMADMTGSDLHATELMRGTADYRVILLRRRCPGGWSKHCSQEQIQASLKPYVLQVLRG
jgi:hypothetical protein